MYRPLLTLGLLITFLFTLSTGQALASTVNLSSPQVLGKLKLNDSQLKAIKAAMIKAMKGPIDDSQQCGNVRLDCVVRAATEWKYQGETFREIVINLHAIGDASVTVSKSKKGSWPNIKIK